MKTFVKRAFAVLLALTIAVGITSADPLKVGTVGAARIYDDSNVAVKDAKAVGNMYTVRTSDYTLVLSNDTATVNVSADTLLQLTSVDVTLEIYLLDGSVTVTSANDFRVRTTATSYDVKANSRLFVISSDSEETAFVEGGEAEALNLITDAATKLTDGTYIDNAIIGFAPERTTGISYWGERASQTAMPEPAIASETVADIETADYPEQEATLEHEAAPEHEAVQEQEKGKPEALRWNYSYRGIDASIEAYAGRADITYSAFITDEEASVAAALAVKSYPEYTKDMFYSITGPGMATATYPESYTVDDFNFATDLIGKALTGYIDSLTAPDALYRAEAEETASQSTAEISAEEGRAASATEPAISGSETREQEVLEPSKAIEPSQGAKAATTEQAGAEQDQAGTVPMKTPIETATKNEIQSQRKARRSLRFGASVGAVYGNRVLNDGYASFADGRVGTFMHSVRMYVDPYIQYKGFKLGLHLPFDFKIIDFTAKPFIDIDMDNYSWSFNGIADSANTIFKFISVLEMKGDKLSFLADRESDMDFSNPAFGGFRRIHETEDKLLARMDARFGGFHVEAFIDDLSMQARIKGGSQYAGLRAGFGSRHFGVGVSAIADIKADLAESVYYPGLDVVVPFDLMGKGIELYVGGAAQVTMEGLGGILAEGMVSVTSSSFTFGAGAAFNHGHHFNDIINDGPTDITTQFKGDSVDALLKASLLTKHFALEGSMNIPFSLEGSKASLVRNTVRTKGGSARSITADKLNLQADLMLGSFTFSVGAVYDGLCGQLSDLAKEIIRGSDIRSALRALINPDLFHLYAIAGVKLNSVSLFARADLENSVSDGRLTLPVSVGGKVTF